MTHRIQDVHYEPGTNDGPLDCACGWSGRASAYDRHRGVVPRLGARSETCPRGHSEYEDDGRGNRRCRPCHRETSRRHRDRKRERRRLAREASAAA